MSEPRPPVHTLRPLVHAAVGLVALSLGVLPRALAIAGAAFGVLVGWVILPRTPLDARLRRPGEPFVGGLRTYPLAVLLLVVLLPPAEAAAAWGVLAFGDAAASLVGPRVRSPSVFGHRKATWAGSAALLLVGALGGFALGRGTAGLGELTGVATGAAPGLVRCATAALAAALVDLVPIPPDDNLPCAGAAGGVLWAWRAVL